MTMATQRVVQCTDILVHVFEQLSPIWIDRDTEEYFGARDHCVLARKTLFSAARVSHAFSELALDVLWSVLDRIDPLLLLLPITVVPGLNDNDPSKMILVHDITPEQWSRFRAYTKRIRELSTARGAQVDLSVWILLGHRCQGAPLLPNLRRVQLRLRISSPEVAFYFLSPSVTNLQMFVWNEFHSDVDPAPAYDVAGVLYQLVLAKLPHLRTLKVIGGLSQLRPQYLEPLKTMQSLLDLSMIDSGAKFDHAMLLCVSRFASLRMLSAEICDGFQSDALEGVLKGAFGNLVELRVRGRARELDALFTLADLRMLSTLHMNFTEPSSVPEICHAIRRASSAVSKALEHCQLELIAEFDPQPLGFQEIVAPLLVLPNMLTFHMISNRYIPHVSDEDILSVASAWPKLEYIGLWKERAPPAVFHNPSVAALVGLARLCPNLTSLMFRFLDVTSLPDKHTLAVAGHTAMQYIDIHYLVGAPTTVNLFDLAIVIDVLFPNLVPQQSGTLPANFYHNAESLPEDGTPDPWMVTRTMLSAIQHRRRYVWKPSGEQEGERAQSAGRARAPDIV